MPMPCVARYEEVNAMSTVERITPILARTVMVMGILTALGSALVAGLVGEPKLLLMTGFAIVSSGYGRQVAQRDQVAPVSSTESAGVHPVAA
jgi:hypothetical protein